jgi:hypothetical protein
MMTHNGLDCIDNDSLNGDGSDCRGEVREYTSRSGCTVSARCEGHQDAYEVRMDEVCRGVDERYPGWNTPGSVPPAWFDSEAAGERWDDDY